MVDISQQKFDPERINQMSAAFNSLSAVTATLTDGAEELKNLAPDVDRSVLSEDGLYNRCSDNL